MNRREMLLAGSTLITGSHAAIAQTGDSSITGMVVYRGGEPANARIYVGLKGKYRQTVSKLKAGRNVGYTLEGMLPGRYELMVTAPAAKPKRLWGLKLSNYDKRMLNFVLERAATPAEEHFYLEEGVPILDDVPREWNGGWLEGILLNTKGDPVEGTVRLLRNGTVFQEMPAGSPLLPAYFESRTLPPGTWELQFYPSGLAKLKPIRIERIVVDQNSRTVFEPIRVPPGAATDDPVTLEAPKRTVTAVPAIAPRLPKR